MVKPNVPRAPTTWPPQIKVAPDGMGRAPFPLHDGDRRGLSHGHWNLRCPQNSFELTWGAMVTFDLDVLGAAELMTSKTSLKELSTKLGKAGLAIHAHFSEPALGTVAQAEATCATMCKRSMEKMVTKVNPRAATGVDHCEISIQGH